MAIKIGNNDITLKLGSSDVTAAYIGDTLVYSGGTPPTPTFQGKWKATYSDSSVTSAECDSSSAITYNEINLTNLVSVEIGDCVTSIGYQAFSDCRSLTSIDIPNNVTSIGDEAFWGCSGLTSIDIPSGVTTIGEGAFGSCDSITSIDIPSGVTSIGGLAFIFCTSLTSIDIPSGVTTIGDNAFQFCFSLTSITVNATTPPTLGSGAFDGSTCPILVPSQSVNVYKSASGWSDYADRIQAIPVPTPTLQWVTFSNGDTIPSDLEIYGVKGVVNDLSKVFYGAVDECIYFELDRNKYNVIIGGYSTVCYSEYGIISNTSVEYIFSNIGCSDSYTVSSKTIANMSNDIQLYIYA